MLDQVSHLSHFDLKDIKILQDTIKTNKINVSFQGFIEINKAEQTMGISFPAIVNITTTTKMYKIKQNPL